MDGGGGGGGAAPRSKLQAAQGFSLTYDNAPVSLHPSFASSSSSASLLLFRCLACFSTASRRDFFPFLMNRVKLILVQSAWDACLGLWEWNRCRFPSTASCTFANIQRYLKCCYLGNVAFRFKMLEFWERIIDSHIVKCCFIH